MRKFLFTLLLTMLSLCMAIGLAGCSSPEKQGCKHVYGELEYSSCIEDGRARRYCELCGTIQREEVLAPGHNIVNGECTRCYAGVYFGEVYDGQENLIGVEVGGFRDPALDDLETYGQFAITSIEIPATVTIREGYDDETQEIVYQTVPVLGIDYKAFDISYEDENIVKLEEIILPDGLQYIGDFAFEGCDNLTEMVIPESVTEIGYGIFCGCDGITDISKIKFPSSVTEYNGFFDYCSGIKDLMIPEGFTKINGIEGEFDSITIPKSATEMNIQYDWNPAKTLYYNAINMKPCYEGDIEVFALSSFADLTLVIGKDVEKLPKFSGGIKEIIFESGSVCDTADFGELYKLEKIVLQESIVNINFSDCRSLKSIDLSAGNIKTIPEDCFYRCESLTEIVLPDSVERVEDNAFTACSSLEKLTLGKNINFIGTHTLSGCNNFKELYYNVQNEIEAPSTSSSRTNKFKVIIGEGVKTFTIIYGRYYYSEIDIYSIEDWCRTRIVDPTSASNWIQWGDGYNGELTLRGEPITSVTVPSDVTELNGHFQNAVALKEVKLHDNFTTIGAYTFYRCTALESFDTGNGVTTIDHHALENCSELKSLTLGEKVVSVASSAVERLPKMQELYLKTNNLTSNIWIFKDSSWELPYLQKVILDKGVTKVAVKNKIGTIDFAMTLKEYCKTDFASAIFGKADNITINGEEFGAVLTIPTGTTKIGAYTFANAPFTKVYLPDELKEIGDYAFKGCASLTSISGGLNVKKCGIDAVDFSIVEKKLHNGVYYKLNKLVEVQDKTKKVINVKDGTDEIYQNAFEGCTNLLHVYIPKSVQKIGAKAFFNTNLNIRVMFGADTFASGDWRILQETTGGNLLIGGSAMVNGVYTSVGSIDYDIEFTLGYMHKVNKETNETIIYGTTNSSQDLKVGSYLNGPFAVGIADMAFYGLSFTKVTLPDEIKEIGELAFANCTALEEIVMNKVEEIGSGAFMGCTALTTIKNDSVIYIRVGAFMGCTSLKEITLAETIKYINDMAFMNCTMLEKVIFADDTKTWYFIDSISGSTITETVIVDKPIDNATHLTQTFVNYGWVVESEISFN